MMRINNGAFEQSLMGFPPFKGSKGSIVRLKIRDFMTYHLVEMTAGPNVNLIMGPNGTGKSTIVCAICLGLAGKAKFLGRAHALKEYIRHGAKRASVEIELYGAEEENWVIRRDIQETKSGASSDWFLNNRKTPESQITDLMAKLNIQLDNLCQFLPQDRVQDFAKMEPVELLENTEKSIDNNAGLLAKHAQLKELQEEIKLLEQTQRKFSEELRNETAHTNRMEHDVRAFNDRKELLEKIHEYEGKKLWLKYVKAMDEFTALKEKYNELSAKKNKEEKIIAPLKKEIDSLNQKLSEYRTTMIRHRNQNNTGIDSLKRNYRDASDNADALVHSFKAELETAEKSEKERVKRLEEKKERLKVLRNELEEMRNRGDLDEEAMNREIKDCDEAQTRYSSKIFEIKGLDATDESDIRMCQNRMKKHERELNTMNEFRNSRIHYLERRSPDVAKAAKYFFDPENQATIQQRLIGKIHEPLILHINVNDLAYGSVAERHIPPSDLTAFFCENKNDVKTLIQMSLEKNWRVSVIHHDMGANFVKPQSIMTEEYRRTYFFQKNLIDLIEAPDYYMSYLCKTVRPQDILIGSDKTDALTSEIMNNTQLRNYYTRKHAVIIRTSYYTGQKNATTSYLSDPRIFTATINAVEIERLKESMRQITDDMKRLQNQISSRKPELEKWLHNRQKVEQRKREINNRIAYRIETMGKMQSCENFIAAMEADKQDVEQLREKLGGKILKERMKQLTALESCSVGIRELAERRVDLLVVQQQTSLVHECVAAKQNQYDDAKINVNQCINEMKTLEVRVKAATESAKKHKADARVKTNQQDPPADVARKEINETKVDGEINKCNAQLNFLPDTDERIVETYNKRMQKITELEKIKSDTETNLHLKKTEILNLKSRWLEPLEELVQRINTNFGNFFRQMQCVGEVSLDRGEDENNFSKYGIKIKVKFRSNEPLVELCGWKQSGGERAITTALYILSLQELTKVPFRVIDEINQGMDAKNEARFFRLLCSLAKGEDTPQYFLLTPKMLPPVDYPDNVDFHIIFNGPYVKVGFQDSQDVRKNGVSQDDNTDEESDSCDSDEDMEVS
ncbi:unnamed protein product [Allacma fusca]|uniref:RecF/RecN/SMC N-terminal domain-containing protein n=1 Tax=Allacma fusca TaxID=39272 RepID=A0A8J2K154_9HEXA|nr:unnamed protein product [Allacma fusca]